MSDDFPSQEELEELRSEDYTPVAELAVLSQAANVILKNIDAEDLQEAADE